MNKESEISCEADFKLLDSYQRFSTELVRIGLAGIGLLGFFIKEAAQKLPLSGGMHKPILVLLSFSAVGFLISAAFALAHRYHSTDGLFYQIRSLRRFDAGRTTEAEADKKTRNAVYHRSAIWLGLAALACFVAALLLVVAIFLSAAFYCPEA